MVISAVEAKDTISTSIPCSLKELCSRAMNTGALERTGTKPNRTFCLPVPSSGRAHRVVHDFLGLADNDVQVGLVLEALCVDFVDVLGTRRTGGEPAVGGRNFQAADWGVVAGSAGQLGRDGFPGKA